MNDALLEQVQNNEPARGLSAHLKSFLAPLAGFLADAAISEIVVNGFQEVFVERKGQMQAVESRFLDAESLNSALRAIAQSLGKIFDVHFPILEGRLPDGSRIQAVHESLTEFGACLAIRRHRQMHLTLADWLNDGRLTQEQFDLLAGAIFRKENILVSGGTGTGKSTFVSSLAAGIPQHERVIVIEDNRELSLNIAHKISLEAGDNISVAELFRASLRLRPDRIIIGEIRGSEALALIAAMTSGHGGCLSTIHASSPLDALRRLETLALGAQNNLPHLAIREQAESAIDWVVQICRTSNGERKVTEVVSREFLRGDKNQPEAAVLAEAKSFSKADLRQSTHGQQEQMSSRSEELELTAAQVAIPRSEANR